MTIAVCYFIRFIGFDDDYLPGYNFQNFFVGETKQRNEVDFMFAPFGVSSGAGTKGGDRSDSAIVAAPDLLAVSLFVQACKEKWLCEITSVLLDPKTYEEVLPLTTETWFCSLPEISTERAVLRLASPLDAVNTRIPRRVLSTKLVGNLPATGNLPVA